MSGVVINIAVQFQLFDDFSEDFASSFDVLGGSHSSSFLSTEDGFQGSQSNVLAFGDVNLSGNCGSFVEEPVGVNGVGIISMSGFYQRSPLRLKTIYFGELDQVSFFEEFSNLLNE